MNRIVSERFEAVSYGPARLARLVSHKCAWRLGLFVEAHVVNEPSSSLNIWARLDFDPSSN